MVHQSRAQRVSGLSGLVGLWLALAPGSRGQAAPVIEITNVPPFGSLNDLRGRVLNAAPASYRVAVFIYVPGAGWWSKPYCNPQLTVIQPNSSWVADITTGGADAYATRIMALLVSSSYSEPCVTGLWALPTNVLGQAVASATVTRADTTMRWIKFSGYDWWVKNSPGQVGPGPNYFSDSTNNVWVDSFGRLHLRITNRSNLWQCAEIVSARTFGFGSYRFELESAANDLNLNAVLGLFTWSDDPAYAHREIDVEISRWGAPNDANNSQFVVQPWDSAGHLVRYATPAGLTHSTHLFTWQSNRVILQSQAGSYSPNPAPTKVVTNWTYSLDTPQTGDENVRLNLWLMNGVPPAGNVEVEFVVRSFQFVPPGAPLPALVTNFSVVPGTSAQFEIQGQPDRRYQIEGTGTQIGWQVLDTVLATNASTRFTTTNVGPPGRFFRTLTLP